MVKKNIIDEGSAHDKERFPTYDPTDAISCTPRELTLKLVKQHDFLMHRVVALLETIHKHNMNKYVDGLPQADINAEETLSRQDVSIKSLKRENSFIKK